MNGEPEARVVDFLELMHLLYQEKQTLVSLAFGWSGNGDELFRFRLQDQNQLLLDYETRDDQAIEHLHRFHRTYDPTSGPIMMKIHDMEKHWEAWDEVTKISQHDRDKARRRLLKGDASIDFAWSDLLHDAMGKGSDAFHKRFLPLRKHHTLLLAHVEILAMQAVNKLDKLEKNEAFADSVKLVRNTLGYVESPDGFLPRLLDVPGGPQAIEVHVRRHAGVAESVIDALVDMKIPNRIVNLYTALSTYTTMLEALRVPLRIIAKCLERTHPTGYGSTDGKLSDLVDFLCSHPVVGERYTKFLDADLRHAFAHAWYRFTEKGVELVRQDNPNQTVRIVSVDELFDKLRDLVLKFTPAALYGALMSYYLDARMMMTTIPYAEWLVGLDNTKR